LTIPGSKSAKICGSTDPNPRAKYTPKAAKKTFLLSKPKSELLKKSEIFKNFLIFEWFIKF